MSKVALSSIKSLTFYNDAQTLARRTDPISQLTCIGKPCKLYQPEVVRCTNAGGSGVEVDWKCEADLPESLRFGRVEVSCEGWSRPGDPYVLKGSCGLQYRLVEIPNALRNDDPSFPSRTWRWLRDIDPASLAFSIIWFGFLALILWSMVKACLRSRNHHPGQTPGSTDTNRPQGPSGSMPGWFGDGGTGSGHTDPPPPYSKHPNSEPQNSWWNPGFWTGAALGGLGAHLLNGVRRPTTAYDWERERLFRPTFPVTEERYSSWSSGPARRPAWDAGDRGEGSSNLGSMRRSTGLGGSSVR